jgi:hypothetical protein
MRPKIRCDGESTVLLQNFLNLNWAHIQQRKTSRNRAKHGCFVLFFFTGCVLVMEFVTVAYMFEWYWSHNLLLLVAGLDCFSWVCTVHRGRYGSRGNWFELFINNMYCSRDSVLLPEPCATVSVTEPVPPAFIYMGCV